MTATTTATAALQDLSVDPALQAMCAPSIHDYPALRTDGVTPGSFAIELSNAAYHADRTGISCSKLKTLLRSPAHYHRSLSAPREDSTPAQNIGTSLHTAVLEPHLFDASTALWESGRRAGKEWEAFKLAMDGKVILNVDEMRSVVGMRDAINSYEMPDQPGVQLGSMIARGESEKTIYWVDEETGILCKIRADNLFLPHVTFDLKTCGDSRPDGFLRTQALKLDYDLQAAMYSEGVRAYSGLSVPFCFIAVETENPHGVWLHETGPGTQFYENGMRKFRYALRQLKRCRESNVWPIYRGAYTVMDDIPLYATFTPPDGE
jgi:hypothetical protein